MKKEQKKILIVVVIIALIYGVAAIALNSYDLFHLNGSGTGGGWPQDEYTSLVPAPAVGTVKEVSAEGQNGCSIFMNWTRAEAKEYAKALKKAGFSVQEERDYNVIFLIRGYILKAQNADGVQVSVDSNNLGGLGSIKITKSE